MNKMNRRLLWILFLCFCCVLQLNIIVTKAGMEDEANECELGETYNGTILKESIRFRADKKSSSG